MTHQRHFVIALTLTGMILTGLRVVTAAEESSNPRELYEERTLVYTGTDYKNHSFPYRLLVPADYDAEKARSTGKKWPLLLFLHGAGERGSDNNAQLKYFPTDMCSPENRKKYPTFILAPQCPVDRAWSARSLRTLLEEDETGVADETRAVLQMLENVQKEFPVDPGRIYLTGLSMGGYGSWYLAALQPERWAAVVPICGGGNPRWASRMKDISTWVFHGGRDRVVPPERSRVMVEALKKAGGQPRYTEFPDAGHNSWTPGYRHPEFLPWLFAQKGAPGRAPESAREWFQDAKFGLFVHWGVYSLIGRGEWVMNNQKIASSEYEKLPPRFNPTEFDAAEWVSIVKRAGQKYITITSKHHDGFCMWNTRQTDYDIVDGTPYGKDVLAMLSEECRKQGVKLFFYHSHLDWRHTDYYPRGRTGQASGRPNAGNWGRYMDYLNAQIAELCSPPYEASGFWFDGWWDRPDADWQLRKTYGIIHGHRPNALIGNNHHVAPFPGEDFQMFEQDLPGKNLAGFNKAGISALPLETCRTMNNSWGYHENDKAYRPLKQQIRYLVEAVGLGANLLLNVGPMPNGKIPPEAVEILLGMGNWLEKNGESIYGTRPGPWFGSKAGYAVRKGRRAYFHVLEWPQGGTLLLPEIEGLEKVSLLNGPGLAVAREEGLLVSLPEDARNPSDTIIVFDFNRDLQGVQAEVPPTRLEVQGNKTTLPATEAVTTGGIRLEGPPKNSLGFWQNPEGTVTWNVRAPEATTVDVSITYACTKGSAGSKFDVICGDSKLSGEVVETGDWAKFVTVPLGLLSIPKGASQIIVRPTSKPDTADGVMNLQKLDLVQGFVSLFDGKSLENWTGSTGGYIVKDGVITCKPRGGGFLMTKKDYLDFAFRFEFKLPPHGNNGVGILHPRKGDPAYKGFEIQVLDDPTYEGSIQPWQRHGSVYGIVAAKPGHLRPTGEWNTEEIKVHGTRITITLNGTAIVDADIAEVKEEMEKKILELKKDPARKKEADRYERHVRAHDPGFKQLLERIPGCICFCGHGSAVEFRNVRVKDLSAGL